MNLYLSLAFSKFMDVDITEWMKEDKDRDDASKSTQNR